MTDNTVHSPVYRYFTVDLLSNEILEEIPFRGVSYQRTIKGAGSFSGSIPVIDATDNLDLYENTMPGNTAVFVVRDGVCVWGGIIWSRDYDIVSRVLKVDASEFTSYFYHRRIWKTWSQEYGATVVVGGDLAEVTFDSGFSSSLKPGSSVHIDFYDTVNLKYSGYYKVAANPVPTTSKFYLESTKSVADITSVERDDNRVYITTENRHGFKTGDKIYVDLGTESIFTGEHEIKVGGGADTKKFSFQMTGADEGPTNVTGTASRPLPNGTYKNSTITVRTDTYDYIRSLIDSVSKDFTGVDFPNTYIEPGIRTAVDVVSREINSGVAIIETDQKHGLTAGQSVEIKDVDPLYDGEFQVATVTTPKSFSYPLSGYEPQTAVSVLNSDIVSVSATNSVATVTTSTAHGFIVGNNVELTVESDLGTFASNFNGTYEITEVPSTTTFKYKISNSGSLPVTTFTLPTATHGLDVYEILKGSVYQDVSPEYTITNRASTLYAKTITTSEAHTILAGDVITVKDLDNSYNGSHVVVSVTSDTITYANTVSKSETVSDTGTVVGRRSTASIYTAEEISFLVGDSVTIENADLLLRIAEKSYDAANSTATITTAGEHYLQTGDSVDISGLRDTSSIVSKKVKGTGATKEVTLTTAMAHNIEKGDSVEIKDMRDLYTVSKKKLSSNVFTLTTATSHNLAVGNEILVSGITDTYNISAYKLKNNVATLTIGNHNFRVNDNILVTSLKDSALVVSKELQAGIAILTTDLPHNFVEGMEIVVSGVGDPYNGSFTITSVTDTQVLYETAVTSKIREAEDTYNQALASAVRRGVANPSTDADVVKARTNLTNLLAGKNADMAPAKVSSATALIKSKTSILNGENRISAVTSSTVSYQKGGNDAPYTPVVLSTTTISKKKATAKDCTLTVASVANFKVGDKVTVPAGLGSRFAGDFLISSISDTTDTKTVTYMSEGAVVEEVSASGTLTSKVDVSGSSPFNGKFTVASAPSGTTVTYNIGMSITSTQATDTVCTVKFTSKYPIAVGDQITIAGVSGTRYNGTFTVATLTTSDDVVTVTYTNAGTVTSLDTSPTGTITPIRVNISETAVPLAVADGEVQATVSVESIHNGTRTVKSVSNRNTFVFDQAVTTQVDYVDTSGTASVDSIFNGDNKIVTVTSDTTFEFALTGSKNNILETANTQLAFVSVDGIYNGTHTVTAIDAEDNQFYFSLTPSRRAGVPIKIIPGYGHATVSPIAIVSSFGPFPGNADIGITFSTKKYSGVNIFPTTYRGFELRSVGEVLNSYADSIDGFEYRIDCEYDEATNSFKKVFVLIPINFPAAPPAGEVSPLSRFGADKLVFEYPGNIANVTLKETAENSATRFFAVGETDLGPAAGPPFSVRAADEFLTGTSSGRRWPLLDADVKVKDIQDETALYPYATRYLTESRPPEGQFTVSVNGSLSPFIGTYAPGDWCSVIVKDKFILERMRNDIELRDTVLVRKIDAMKVSVPDGTTFPETVELILIPEWEVDKVG